MADLRRAPVTGVGVGDTPSAGVPPQLELDQLLAQLVDRAHDVMAAQSRLRGLLAANTEIIGDLTLTTVLRKVVESACGLVHAKYGAIGVLHPDRSHLEEFIHVGVDAATVERIGQLPTGGGLLGALIDDPRPIRLRTLGEDPRSVGFPAGHPPMSSFLGVPIRVRDEVFGNLYLAEADSGEFSADDEHVVVALAATAGVVIENARLFDAARRRQEWLEASMQITRNLIADTDAEPLQLIAEKARQTSDSDVATVVMPAEEPGRLRVQHATGCEAGKLVGLTFDVEGGTAGEVFATRAPVMITDAAAAPLHSHLAEVLHVGPVLAVPLIGTERIRGVLTLGRLASGSRYSDSELQTATAFANHAAMALELADARADQQRMELLEDRDRIARDLHDHVIQRLFAAGLTLQGLAAGLGTDERASRLAAVVGDLDDTIAAIRTTIFGLRGAMGPAANSTRARVMEVIADLTPVLGLSPRVLFAGPIDSVVDSGLVEDLVAVVRESLTNVARHANATRVDVSLTARYPDMVLEVTDDGVGLGDSTRRSGLSNLRSRAQARGGTLEVGPAPLGQAAPGREGTYLTWTIPLP